MANNCQITLKIDKLPKVIKKVEFFLFEAMKQNNVDFFDLAKNPADYIVDLMSTAKNIIETEINNYINQATLLKDEEPDVSKTYESFAQNLQNIVSNWPIVMFNTMVYSKLFGVKTKFKLDEKGMVDLEDILRKTDPKNYKGAIATFIKTKKQTTNPDKIKFKLDEDALTNLSEMADDEDAIYKKFIVDQSANEIDPFDTIDKAIELFIHSIPKANNSYDEYGFNVGIDYSSFVMNLMADLEGTLSINEMIDKLEINKEKNPEYQYIIDKLKFKPSDNSVDIQFKINFRNSFAKAQIPIYVTSLEGLTIKTLEATKAKRSKYEISLKSNFYLNGMPFVINGKEDNFAFYNNGSWELNKDSVNKILNYLQAKHTITKDNNVITKNFITYSIDKIGGAELINRKINFLKALGFELSQKTEDVLKVSLSKKESKKFEYLLAHLLSRLSIENKNTKQTDTITDLISAIKGDWITTFKKVTTSTKDDYVSEGQNNTLNDFIEVELKYNQSYNIERSVINPKGDRVHTAQLHNNFTIVNKYLSDNITFSNDDEIPPLLKIINTEPSLAWINPVTNPGIRKSLYLNSLFFLDPKSDNFGKRKRVTKTNAEFSATEGEYVVLNIVNTGYLQTKDENNYKSDSSATTDLNEADKLLQDLNIFMQAGFSSVTRLSDKSTDLGIFANYYSDPLSGKAAKRVLGSLQNEDYKNVFKTEVFVQGILNGLSDFVGMKYLGYKGFYDNLDFASKNILNTWGEFDKVLSKETKDKLEESIKSKDISNVEQAEELLNDKETIDEIKNDIYNFFTTYSNEYLSKLEPIKNLVDSNYLVKSGNLESSVKYYLASTFLIDLANLQVFFGNAIHFKDFHKRASKDSATGVFTLLEPDLINKLNDKENNQGYGVNTNLSSKLLIERLFIQGKITLDKRNELLLKQDISKEFKSAIIKEVKFSSKQPKNIIENIEKLYREGEISEHSYNLFTNDTIKVVRDKYNGDEADGQGKCTFDFYRIMSILTNNWDKTQEIVYKKIIMYAHYNELIEGETDDTKRAEYISKRDELKYDPLEQVYFPPKKFQYSGPMKNEKIIDGALYNALIPMFDKFSLQPLIPTIIKGTEDEELAKRMEYEGLSYVKLKSASKVETPIKELHDSLYENYDENNPEIRFIKTFEQRLSEDTTKFNSEHVIFMTHLKEQVRIDAEVHDETIFGSQARKLILMNLLSLNTEHNREEFKKLYNQYKGLIDDLVEIEKTSIYNKLGIEKSSNGKLKLSNIKKLVEYFRDEINKKNQDSNVIKALDLDENGNFKIPLDAAVQAQIIEGILISSINNNIVRYKASGSMLTQVSITGSAKKFSKKASEEALQTYGNIELKYYDIIRDKFGRLITSAMQVKVGFTKQWLPLLQLNHFDGNKINSIERINECLKNEDWVDTHRDSIRMVSYRIPTQGRNFLDVMEIAEFLPAHFGDAIIMPSEMVNKNGGDFDIDKMFVFYANLSEDGIYENKNYDKSDLKKYDANNLKGSVQNKIFKLMADIILHPNNYMELVTPSENYHILPIIDTIYDKLGLKKSDESRPKTDYKNTDILNRARNIEKFLSLLNGKSDLGIAALANTFNVLYQLSIAEANPNFLKSKFIRSYFSSRFMQKGEQNSIISLFYGDMYDEDGILKSEFFSEFISAFVDVAKDDYVFMINVVTEFTAMIFYMKFSGLSSKKILYFINQPILRAYIKNLSKHDNMFVKNYNDSKNDLYTLRVQLESYDEEGKETEEYKKLKIQYDIKSASVRKKALAETLNQFGFKNIKVSSNTKNIIFDLLSGTDLNYNVEFTSDLLYDNIQNTKTFNPLNLNADQKKLQLAVLSEMLNLKVQSDSMGDAQKFLNFDTKPYVSAFDVYVRDTNYKNAVFKENNILSPRTLTTIHDNSVISPLNVASEIKLLLETLLPVRNNNQFNNIILKKALELRNNFENKNITSEDDMLKYARTVRNDFMNYILQNFFDKSSDKVIFQEMFETNLSLNEYLKELIVSEKLRDNLRKIKNLDDYNDLIEQFPIIKNLVIEPGSNTKNLITYRFIENNSNTVEKQSMINQLEELTKLLNVDFKLQKDFSKDLALYSIFQSGFNTSDLSYTGITPIEITNQLYSIAIKEFEKLSETDKEVEYKNFFKLFYLNNPGFYATRRSTDTITGEISKKGKWYNNEITISELKRKETPKPKSTKKLDGNNTEIKEYTGEVDKIKNGKKTITSYVNKLDDGVYKLVNNQNNNIFVELKLYKLINLNDLNSSIKKESFATNYGFENWNQLLEYVENNYTKAISKEFIEGNQYIHVYKIKYLPEGGAQLSNNKTVYQGYNTLENREFNYYTLNQEEAKNYGENVRQMDLDTTGFIKTSDDDYKNLLSEFNKLGKNFDILDNSKEGLIVQNNFFKFLRNKGYKGLDMLNKSDSQYAVSFESSQSSTSVKPGVLELFDSNFLIFTESKTSDEVISKLLSNKIIDKKCN